MAGRGRGRGRGMSINIEALGLGRGDVLPPVLQPPPLYPPLSFKPVPLIQSDEMDYMLALKQELTGSFKKSPYFIKALNKSRDIERYSDKYQLSISDAQSTLNPDWSRLPGELNYIPKRKKRSATGAGRPNLKAARRGKAEDVTSLLEKLEKKEEGKFEDADEEEDDDDKEKEKKKDDEDEVEDDVEYDEEEQEDETDYNMAYFDNGEDNENDEAGDEDEGPTY